MARKKVTFDELNETFNAVSKHLQDAEIRPMEDDEGKVLLLSGNGAKTYSASTLKGHLEFLNSVMSNA